ncbi:hypothetical protein SEMRO_310_G114140.1 [Seminavis robusta]|uniref:Uncharacterized protein n=1 Tax=Seminavis robusta TaxID=568900 RepID=A0A9N8DR34_9STRA|nr:hypothetical protein SEMRO_310_G114140.1 [Seminavis robusta]|eukprot:Sro310_g114140.1 n/a (285) ;mRNA; r:61441-62295
MTDLYSDSYDDAPPDFLTDLVLHGEEKVQTKYVHKNGSIRILEGGDNRPRFTVLTFERETRSYPNTGIHFTVWVMQLLDGSYSIIKAVTDTSLAKWLEGKEMMSGCTLIVPDFRIVRLQTGDEMSTKMIMLIKDCGWVYPPDVDLPYVGPQEKARPWGQIFDEEENFRAPSRRITHFYHGTIEKNMKYGHLIFTEERRESRQAHRWNSYVRSDVLRSEYSEGHWIMSGDTRKCWDQRMNDKKAATAKKRDLWEESDDDEKVVECACISTFIYKDCIAKQYTIDM